MPPIKSYAQALSSPKREGLPTEALLTRNHTIINYILEYGSQEPPKSLSRYVAQQTALAAKTTATPPIPTSKIMHSAEDVGVLERMAKEAGLPMSGSGYYDLMRRKGNSRILEWLDGIPDEVNYAFNEDMAGKRAGRVLVRR